MHNIVYMTRHVPNPNGLGVERRCHQHITALGSRYKIELIFITDGSSSDCPILQEDVAKNIASITVLKIKNQKSRPFKLHKGSRLINELLTPITPRVDLNPSTEARLQDILASTSIIFVFRTPNIPIFNLLTRKFSVNCKAILDMDDIESKAIWRNILSERNSLGLEMTATLFIRYLKHKLQEKKCHTLFQSILVCSDQDATEMNALHSCKNYVVLPNGYDYTRLCKRTTSESEIINILFVGTMNYQPNIHAAVWFCANVLPALKHQTEKTINVWVVGFSPTDTVKALADKEGVFVTGGVENLEDYYSKADICIVPIHHGGGTRIKALEAAAKRVPMVSTTVGVEGLGFEPGKDILIGNSADEFACCCKKLIDDPNLRQILAENAFLKASEQFGFPAVEKRLIKIVESLIPNSAHSLT